MAFEKFINTHYRQTEPMVSISARGQISLNKGSIKKFNLDKFKYAVLHYDAEGRKIGIKFTNEKEEGALKIGRNVKRGGAFISGRSFFKYYQFGISKTEKYDIAFDDKHKLYVIDLTAKSN
jgi:hypothetical protein